MTLLWKDHLPLLVLQAGLIAWFLALLWKEPGRRRGFFLRIWLALLGGSAAVAWLMSAAGRPRP